MKDLGLPYLNKEQKLVQDVMEKKGWTREQLANHLGVSKACVDGWFGCRGTVTKTMQMLLRYIKDDKRL